LRKGDGLFVKTCKNVSKNFPEIEFTEQYVDACAMNLIRKPDDYDIILTTNMFGIFIDEVYRCRVEEGWQI
jgi:3-isopropylmalate dehydrogenase